MNKTTEQQARPVKRDLHGILLIDKPAGISSNRALQQVKRALGARKAGHTGSLDPLATGMLPLCFGDATRLSQRLLDADKTYEATAALGSRTDSGDAEGRIIETAPVPALNTSDWRTVAASFVGDIMQVPPMYSALKHGGHRLYELARRGQEVERAPRRVRIHRLEVLASDAGQVTIRVRCSKGTYIRTLVEDLARAAGTLAHTSALRRTEVSPFGTRMIELARVLAPDWTAAGLEQWLLPVDAAVPELPRVELGDELARRYCHGQRLAGVPVEVPEYGGTGREWRVHGRGGRFLGLAERLEDGVLRPNLVMAGACEALCHEIPVKNV